MRRIVLGLAVPIVGGGFSAAAQPVPDRPPALPFVATADFLKYSPDMNLGEVLGVAVNSKGSLVVLNHPGTATSGPLYGNATTQLLEFDRNGRFVREIGKGVYGLGYGHSVRFDRHDNLWVVDKGTNSVMKFNPAGYVTMNLGRRPEGYEDHERWDWSKGAPPHRDGFFDGPTDIGWDADDNIYISDGYVNSRIAKFDKHGNWIKSWGSRGTEPGQLRLPHSLQVDRRGNVYVADRTNRRIQVFDSEGNFQRIILLNAPYDKKRQPVLGNLPPVRPDETAPWTLCISNGPTQHLYASDEEPGRVYRLTLDGKILGVFGESGRQVGQFNWIHGIACRSDDTLYVADMNNWRVQRLTVAP
jgi:DNA-binding beta-propeller fold protein YncE